MTDPFLCLCQYALLVMSSPTQEPLHFLMQFKSMKLFFCSKSNPSKWFLGSFIRPRGSQYDPCWYLWSYTLDHLQLKIYSIHWVPETFHTLSWEPLHRGWKKGLRQKRVQFSPTVSLLVTLGSSGRVKSYLSSCLVCNDVFLLYRREEKMQSTHWKGSCRHPQASW